MNLEFAEALDWATGHRTGQDIKVSLSLLKNHVLIVGGSGSGKTHLAKAMLEQTLLAGVPTIAIDSQGDLLWLTRVKPGNSAKKRALRTIPKKIFTGLFGRIPICYCSCSLLNYCGEQSFTHSLLGKDCP